MGGMFRPGCPATQPPGTGTVVAVVGRDLLRLRLADGAEPVVRVHPSVAAAVAIGTTVKLVNPGDTLALHRRLMEMPSPPPPVLSPIPSPTPPDGHPASRPPRPLWCRRGHRLTPKTTYLRPNGSRECRVCIRDRLRRRSEEARLARYPRCPNGHPQTPENVVVEYDGRAGRYRQRCRRCLLDRVNAHARERRARR